MSWASRSEWDHSSPERKGMPFDWSTEGHHLQQQQERKQKRHMGRENDKMVLFLDFLLIATMFSVKWKAKLSNESEDKKNP